MSKNCQILSTSQYNHLRKTFRGQGVCKNRLLRAKGAKIAVEQHKGSLIMRSKIRNSIIFQKYNGFSDFKPPLGQRPFMLLDCYFCTFGSKLTIFTNSITHNKFSKMNFLTSTQHLTVFRHQRGIFSEISRFTDFGPLKTLFATRLLFLHLWISIDNF